MPLLEMRSFVTIMSVLIILCAFCISTACSLRAAPIYKLEDAELHFETFIQNNDKVYANENEKKARFEIFKVNLEEVNRLNDGQDDTVFGLTPFMDITHDEFLKMFNCFGKNFTAFISCSSGFVEDIQDVQVPDSFDWRQQNVVTSVKNQHDCGACYAFSGMANVESHYAIKYGQHLDLAEQQIVDCDSTSQGCEGGWMSNTFLYLMKAGGAVSERDYPYQNRAGLPCRVDTSRAIVRVAGCHSYNQISQEQLKQILYTTGPISIAIKASGWSNYYGGLITDQMCNVGAVNHAVLLVGYGFHSSGVPIWIVKNSWGTQWGDQGYGYIVRGDNYDSCGMINQLLATSIVA